MVVSIPLVADVPGATQYPPSRPRDRRVAWPPGQINALARTISASEENGPAEQLSGLFETSFAGGGTTSGALVAGVVPASPAGRAALAVGDVITSLDGHSVASPAA